MNVDNLITAIYRNDVTEFARMLQPGDVNCLDADGRTLLMCAVLVENPDLRFVQCLIANGADVNLADREQWWTALHFAARDQHEEIVLTLLEAEAAVDVVDRFGNSPLWHCVMAKTPNLVILQALLERGADPNKKNHYGVSPRDIAEKVGNVELLAILEQGE